MGDEDQGQDETGSEGTTTDVETPGGTHVHEDAPADEPASEPDSGE